MTSTAGPAWRPQAAGGQRCFVVSPLAAGHSFSPLAAGRSFSPLAAGRLLIRVLDVCDRCGAQAYVRVLLASGGELLFCADHGRNHAEALANVAVDIQDQSNRLSKPAPQ